MKHLALTLKDKIVDLRQFDKTCKALRKHLDRMRVGLPAALYGEIRKNHSKYG